MSAAQPPSQDHASKPRRPKVLLRPLGQHLYEVSRDGEVVGLGFFKRRHSRNAVSTEAWLKRSDGTVVELWESYFADFVRWVRNYA